MNPKSLSKTIVLNDGREIIIETGKLAKQAHGSVVIKMGNCMLLSTVVSNYGESTLDFLPLTVDYREKFASAGRFLDIGMNSLDKYIIILKTLLNSTNQSSQDNIPLQKLE